MLADWEVCKVEFDDEVFVLRLDCSAVVITSSPGAVGIGAFARRDGLPDVQEFFNSVAAWRAGRG